MPGNIRANGDCLAHYRLTEKIGEGGMGVVYRAWDTRLEREVALKLLRDDVLRGDQSRARLLREAKLASSLNHPYIATIYDLEHVEDQDIIAMEFVRGQTLGQRLVSGPMELREALDVAIAIADGLGEAHDKGVVHRDVKPDNIIVTPRGYPKIMDFGLAKIARDRSPGEMTTKLSVAGMIMGTVAYMSPEQAAGEDVGAAADIFSFGLVLYELLTQKPAFSGNSDVDILYGILHDQPAPISDFNPSVPSDLQAIVSRCTAKSPADRYPSAQELYEDLKLARINLDIQHARTLDTLSTISHDLASILEIEPLTDRIATVVKSLIDYDVLGVFRVDEQARRLNWVGGAGYTVERARETVYSADRGLCGRAIRTRETVRLGDVRDDPEYYPPNGEAFLSNLVVPLIHMDRVIAVINMESRNAHSFTDEHVTVMSTLAGPIAVAMANADLFDERRRHSLAMEMLHDIGREFSSILDLDSLLDRVGQLTAKVIKYDMFAIFLLDSETGVFSWRKAIGYDPKLVQGKELRLGDGIISRAAQERCAVIVDDTSTDADFIEVFDVNGTPSRSELAVPLLVRDEVLGVISLESIEASYFKPEHADLMSTLASQVAVAIENARLYRDQHQRAQQREKQAEHILRRFESFVTPHIAEQVFKDPQGKTLAGERRDVTVLVADICGFTSVADAAPPEEVVRFLQEFFSVASHVVFKYEGTVDKFIGDALMAFYGAPVAHDPRYGPADAQRAVFAALDLRDAFGRLRDKWWKRHDLFGTLELSFGITTGNCLLGNMGSDKRVEYTAIGSAVNQAFSLCRSAEPGQILIGGLTGRDVDDDVKLDLAGESALGIDPKAQIVVGMKYI